MLHVRQAARIDRSTAADACRGPVKNACACSVVGGCSSADLQNSVPVTELAGDRFRVCSGRAPPASRSASTPYHVRILRLKAQSRMRDSFRLVFYRSINSLSAPPLSRTARRSGPDEATKATVQKLPMLKTKAGPRDGDAWIERVKEEYMALIQVRSASPIILCEMLELILFLRLFRSTPSACCTHSTKRSTRRPATSGLQSSPTRRARDGRARSGTSTTCSVTSLTSSLSCPSPIPTSRLS